MTEAYSQTTKQIEASKQEPKLYLLPLLTPSREILHSSSPPLHLLPKGKLSQERISFQTSSKYGKTTWIESSHVFPSAYPRFEAGQSPSISSQKVAMKLAKDLSSRNQTQQWSLVQRIVPVRPCKEGNMHIIPEGRGLTIVITQIGKFNKKEWEQVVYETIVELEHNEKQHIEEIWFLIGDLFEQERSYEDNLRDVEQFIHSYLPVPSTKEEMKRYGPHWPAHTLKKQRGNSGRKGRVLIGVGHVCSAKLKLFDNMFATYVPNGRQGKTIAGKMAKWTDNSKYKLNDSDARL